MNILEYINTHYDAGDAIMYGIFAFVIWFVFWKLIISKLLGKCKVGSIGHGFLELGVGATFLILIFLLFLIVLFVASIQAVIEYGYKMIFALIAFWGIVITFFVFMIKKTK